MKTIILMGLLALGLTAAKKDRDWLTGKIMASRPVNVGARARQAYPAIGYGEPPTVARTITAAELELFGGEYAFTIRDLGAASLLKRPCRYIVGDTVKYFQEKALLFLLDADGKECRAEVMTQERLPADLKPASSPAAAKP